MRSCFLNVVRVRVTRLTENSLPEQTEKAVPKADADGDEDDRYFLHGHKDISMPLIQHINILREKKKKKNRRLIYY